MLPFRRLPKSTNPVVLVLGQIRDDLAGIGRAIKALPSMRDDLASVHRHAHELKEELVTTKQELLDQIAGVRDVLVETGKDVTRVADRLDEAIASGDLSDVAAAVSELRGLAQDIDDRAEQSAPEPAPAEPTE